MKNKFLSIILAICVVLSAAVMFSVPAAAAGSSLTVKEKSESTSTVVVEVSLTGNTGYASLGFDVIYDKAVLTPVSVEVAGPADSVGMTCGGMDKDSGYTVMVYGGDEVKADGSVCIITFEKNSAVKDGTTSAISLVADANNCYDIEDNSIEVSAGSTTLNLSSATAPTTNPTPKPTNPPAKPSVKPSQKPNYNNGSVPTTLEETTTEESTTEELTTEYIDVTEYPSYQYEEAEKNEDDEDDEDKSQMIKRIIAIAVIVICVGAVVVLLLTRKK